MPQHKYFIDKFELITITGYLQIIFYYYYFFISWRLITLHCWWECKLVQPLWKTIWRFLKKLEIELPYDPAIPLLGIHTKETRSKLYFEIKL